MKSPSVLRGRLLAGAAPLVVLALATGVHAQNAAAPPAPPPADANTVSEVTVRAGTLG